MVCSLISIPNWNYCVVTAREHVGKRVVILYDTDTVENCFLKSNKKARNIKYYVL